MTPAPADKKTLRSFGLILAGGLTLLFGLLIPWIGDNPWPTWPWIAAGVFGGLGLIAPMVLKPLYGVWMKIGHVLGWVNTRIILGIVYFVIFLPVGLIMRLCGNDPMARKLDENVATYRIPSEQHGAERLEKPF